MYMNLPVNVHGTDYKAVAQYNTLYCKKGIKWKLPRTAPVFNPVKSCSLQDKKLLALK